MFTLFLSRFFGYNIKTLFQGIGHSEIETHSNVAIELKVNIAAVLNHEALSSLFEKCRKHKDLTERVSNKSEWIESLIANYKKKYKSQEPFTHEGVTYLWHGVKYNIKNNILWDNGQPDFSDSIAHEVFIPYVDSEKEEESFWKDGIRIRVLVVNGVIKVQVGHFDKETSPEIYRESGLAAYKTWETITTFPLMYVCQDIPTHYLNLSMYATDSYKRLVKANGSKDWMKDWKELNVEIRDYNCLQAAFASDTPVYGNGHIEKIYKRFETKSLEKLAQENFHDPYKRKDDDWPVPPWMEDNTIRYLNDYLMVSVFDYKETSTKNERYYLTDYYEEYP